MTSLGVLFTKQKQDVNGNTYLLIQSAKYQHRKKGRTSNVLVLTDGRGYPIGIGDIISGNHNDLYDIIGLFSKIMNQIKKCGIFVENSYLNADKGFDCKKLRRAIHRRKMFPNIKENPRNRKGNKRGKKRFFDEKVYKKRFVNERSFAWIDSFRTKTVRNIFNYLNKNTFLKDLLRNGLQFL